MKRPAPVEGWRANLPVIRAIGTSASILLSAVWITWQGSMWVADMRSEMREIRTTLTTITKAVDEKAALKDVEYRFSLLCARAPVVHRVWVCNGGKT